MAKNRFESSANKCKSKELVQFLKSLIYSKKRSGPRTEPWGTPHEIGNSSEFVFPIEVNCFLLCR